MTQLRPVWRDLEAFLLMPKNSLSIVSLDETRVDNSVDKLAAT